MVKVIYDKEEQSVFLAASRDFRTQRFSQVQMLSVGIHVSVLGAILAFSLRRSFRALWKEIAERARAEESERNRNLELETLFHIAGILVQPGQFKNRSTSVLEEVARTSDADLATLKLLDRNGQILHLMAQAGPAPWQQSAALSLQSGSWAVITTRRAVVSNDYPSHPLSNPTEIERGIKSMVSVPISFENQGGRAILNVVSSKPDHFNTERIRLLGAIVDGLGALLDQAKLSQDLQSNQEEMAGVDEVARIITSTLDIEAVYKTFPIETKKLVPFDQETGSFSVRSLFSAGQTAGEPGSTKIIEGSQIQNVVTSAETIVRHDLNAGIRSQNDSSVSYSELRSSITVPLPHQGRAVGALELLGRKPAKYGEHEVAILERLARHMAPTVENARFYDQTRAERATAITALSRLWAVLDGVDAAIMLVDDNQRALWSNRQFCEFFSLEETTTADGTGQRESSSQVKINHWVADPYAFSNAKRPLAADANYAGPADEIKVSHPVHRTLQRYTTPVDNGQGIRLGRLMTFPTSAISKNR